MNKCRRCGEGCPDDAAYCEKCLSAQPSQEKLVSHAGTHSGAPSFATVPIELAEHANEPEANAFVANPDYSTQPDEEQSPTIPPMSHLTDQTVDKLNDAARRMNAVETREPRLRRISRLSPLQDISSEVQRTNTPHPSQGMTQPSLEDAHEGERKQRNRNRDALELSLPMPDFWPWLPEQGEEEEESEADKWNNFNDPLLSRHLDPIAAERIEQEDVRRAIADGHLPPFPVVNQAYSFFKDRRRLRLFFVIAALLILVSLVFDSLLVSFSLLGSHTNNRDNTIPTLALSSTTASYGQNLTLHISNFRAHSRLYLTHDIGEPIRVNGGRTLVTLGDVGEASVTVSIDSSWEPGFHLLQVEDVDTRYIASTTLHITDGPSRPSHFLLSTKQMDMGNGYQGANTLQQLILHNSGSGSIDWSVSSDQPWLQATPTQGTFSGQQTILIGVQRANLKAGSYTGTLTFASNVGSPQSVKIQMSVRELPPYAGAVLQVTPVTLSYDTMDGNKGATPQALMVSNPGTQPLYWSLASNQPVNNDQNAYLRELDPNLNWLRVNRLTGTIAPHESSAIPLTIDSEKLLPGTYLNMLSFNIGQGHTGINTPQSVAIALTVKPQCSITASMAFMDFVAVAGANHTSTQTLLIKSGNSCPNNIGWQASTLAKWITLTPNSGQLDSTSGATTTVGIAPNNLKPGTYRDTVSITAGHSSLSLPVKLTIQKPPTPMSPILGASPLNLNFRTTAGKGALPGQSVTLTNTGKSPLTWNTAINYMISPWLGASPSRGTIAPGQSGQVLINVNPSKLSPGEYMGQVIIHGVDSKNRPVGGTPQSIMVSLTVAPPCTLAQPSSNALAFSAIKGSGNPMAQSITLSANGNCSWPLGWKANIVGSASWLSLSANYGTFTASNQSTTLVFNTSIVGLDPGIYTAQVNVQANESTKTAAQGSPRTLTVTLTVQPPCTLQVGPDSLTFSGPQGQPISSRNLSIQESGTCVRPVSWSSSVDSNSSSWLSTGGSGSDNGGGSNLSISVSPGSLPPGTYKGTVTVSANGSGGANVDGSPVNIPVLLTITGYKVSGTANFCVDSQCDMTSALPNATVTLSSSGSVVATTTADGSGNFSFSNIGIGSYTVAISSTDTLGSNRNGSVTVTVNDDTNNVVVKAPATGMSTSSDSQSPLPPTTPPSRDPPATPTQMNTPTVIATPTAMAASAPAPKK
ncbi:BACON domain-containing protein [Ktedonospora formicarum]|uniref:BACON domain-containing protein n=1 Tax=Ktedonospora formicarum TaxID=2778364 RepID=A0A8J3HUV1_9CHLR|nr:BACON domain-containing carbohydrate-binding protein [Ktedonospora formicarum]GHO43686.1 hypothetical protein KSX_18490 [Ktedonospora formicarum]